MNVLIVARLEHAAAILAEVRRPGRRGHMASFTLNPRPEPAMDLNLARTFLEIVETRNFARAAERLHVTQTAVSARVRALEDLLGRRLFVRNKAGATLTPAGERFARYARIWCRHGSRRATRSQCPQGAARSSPSVAR